MNPRNAIYNRHSAGSAIPLTATNSTAGFNILKLASQSDNRIQTLK